MHPLRLLSAAAVVAGLVAAPACGGDDAASSDGAAEESADGPDTYSGYRADPPVEVGAVNLPLADGTGEVAMPADPDNLRIVYFGYTSCPDVCPTTMSDLRRALGGLTEEERDRIQMAMVTVDPARDTPDRLVPYVDNFVAGGQALRTEDPDALRAAADAFGANYSVETNEEGEVEVSHTAELYAVGPDGTVLMAWPFGTSFESLQRDIQSLLSEVSDT